MEYNQEEKKLFLEQYRCFIGKEKAEFHKKYPSRKYYPSIGFPQYAKVSLKKRKRRAIVERFVTYNDYLNFQMKQWKRLPESERKEFGSKILGFKEWKFEHGKSIAAIGKIQ